ncbi:MAG: tetratricopeptide repeat protein, partial [Chitinophagaceae bacterium]
LMTKGKVAIYLGSYGDPNKSLHFNIGRLEFWSKYNPFTWRAGLCVPSSTDMSYNQRIIFILAGPFASLIIASIACYLTFSFDLHGSMKIILIIFLGSAIFDLFVNLKPSAKPIALYDGSFAHNDGYRLKQLCYFKKLPATYETAAKLYNQEKYEEAGALFHEMLEKGIKETDIYRLAITSFLQTGKFQLASIWLDEFTTADTLDADDFSNVALAYAHINEHQKSLEYNSKALLLNPEHKYALNNKGYTLNLLNKFEEAIPLFDKAIEIDNDFAYAYNNRGLSKIKTGLQKEGLEDIKHSFTIDENNAYGYRNLGIYHLDRAEFAQALTLFEKAKHLDHTTHGINELIKEAEMAIFNA